MLLFVSNGNDAGGDEIDAIDGEPVMFPGLYDVDEALGVADADDAGVCVTEEAIDDELLLSIV
jgi:hypothetical protein